MYLKDEYVISQIKFLLIPNYIQLETHKENKINVYICFIFYFVNTNIRKQIYINTFDVHICKSLCNKSINISGMFILQLNIFKT